MLKVWNSAKIRTWYNQVPHLIQDAILKNEKYTRKHHLQENQEVSHFPAGDHKAARRIQDHIAKTK